MNIVFVHFLSKPPKYLTLNIQRTINLFPEHKVFLITDLDQSNFKIKGLNYHKYKKEENWTRLENFLTHDKTFRRNFWFLSVVRFLALADFMQERDAEILHIESDVIISGDFPFKLLSELDSKFAFPIVNEYQGIASCLYVKNSTSAKYLRDLTLMEAEKNSKTTDMHILRILSKINRDIFQILPSAPLYNQEIINDDKMYYENKKSISYFKGVFDGVDIGMFLFGQDPRNKRGFTTVRKPTPGAYLDVSKQSLTMTDKRDFPNIYDLNSQQTIPIYSLHIHCKNRNLFNLTRSRSIISRAVHDSKNQPKTEFYLSVFFNSLKASLIRRFNLKYKELNVLKH